MAFPKGRVVVSWGQGIEPRTALGTLVDVHANGCAALLPDAPLPDTAVRMTLELGSPGRTPIDIVFGEALVVRREADEGSPGERLVAFSFDRDKPGVAEAVDLAIHMLGVLSLLAAEARPQ